jgi:15-cis-phytoene synthase
MTDVTTVAYRTCEQITRTEARNFFYGIRLLPADKRKSLCAVYAMARRIDDIGDGDLPADQKLTMLAGVRADLRALSRSTTDPVLVALADAVHQMPIPLDAFDDLIDGCVADVQGRTYATFDELEWYCRCVAGSIGRLCLGVFGARSPDARHFADALGVALQLTNILRDIVEDRTNNRIYLPASDLRQFGCRLDLLTGQTDRQVHLRELRLSDDPERLAALVAFEALRAEAWYDSGLRLLPLLDRRSAACTAAMAGIYHRLLARIAADPLAVAQRRVALSGRQKAWVAMRAIAGGTV